MLAKENKYKKYEDHFIKVHDNSTARYSSFPAHVYIATKWVEILCERYPEAEEDVAMIGAWFHDLGHFVETNEEDHAIASEESAKEFLKNEDVNQELTRKILHTIRAHRNKDVKPDTLEARIVCFADSASHLTADIYLGFMSNHGKESTLKKLERDYRDLEFFPELKVELEHLYLGWKRVIENFPEEFSEYLYIKQ